MITKLPRPNVSARGNPTAGPVDCGARHFFGEFLGPVVERFKFNPRCVASFLDGGIQHAKLPRFLITPNTNGQGKQTAILAGLSTRELSTTAAVLQWLELSLLLDRLNG